MEKKYLKFVNHSEIQNLVKNSKNEARLGWVEFLSKFFIFQPLWWLVEKKLNVSKTFFVQSIENGFHFRQFVDLLDLRWSEKFFDCPKINSSKYSARPNFRSDKLNIPFVMIWFGSKDNSPSFSAMHAYNVRTLL